MERVHHRVGAGDRDRDGDARDQRRPEAAQEEQHHHDDESDGYGLGVLDVGDRRADRPGAVGQDLDLDRRRQPFLEILRCGADAVGGLDDIGAGLAIDIDENGVLLVEASGDTCVGGGVDDIGDIAEPDRRAVAIGDDEAAIGVGAEELVVGADRVGLLVTFEAALGVDRIALGDRGADILKTEAERGERSRVDAHAHGALLGAGDDDLADAVDLRQFLRHHRVGVVVDLAGGQRLAGQRQRHHRRLGRVALVMTRRIGQVLGKLVRRGVDRRLDVASGRVDAAVERELHADTGVAEPARRGELRYLGDLAELAFERRRHRRGHGLRAGAGQRGIDADGGKINRRQRCDGKLAIGGVAAEQYPEGQEERRDRPLDEGG